MTALVDVTAGTLLLCAYVLLPGWALARLVGFASHSALDRTLARLTLGTAWTSLTVTVLLLLGIYVRATAILVLVLPVAALWLGGRGRPGEPRAFASDPDPVDRAVIAGVAVFLLVYTVDALTSPITWWDGLASWGKWAPDWGRRVDSWGYLVGGYPQLVPRIVSVLYKLTGTHEEVLPLAFFAAHAFHVLLGGWFALAAVRLAQLLDLPAWPALLAGFGSMLFREHIGAGAVDVAVTAQVVTLLALYVGRVRGAWTMGRPDWWLLGTAVFTAIFTKLTGLLGPLFVLFWHSPLVRTFAPARAADLALVRRAALSLGLILMLPFILEQGLTELRLGSFTPDPQEVNISVRQTPALLAQDAEITYRGEGWRARPGLIELRFWNSYEIPSTLRHAFTAIVLILLAFAAVGRLGRSLLPVTLLYALVWASWSSYDQRNLFPLLPVVAIALTLGAREAVRAWPRFPSRTALAVACGLFLVLAGGTLLREVQQRATGLTSGPRPLRARITAMSSDAEARIRLYFPHVLDDYTFVRRLSDRVGSTHVLVTSWMFRFLPNGAYAQSLWSHERLRPLDLFAGHEGYGPPDHPGWVAIADGSSHRFWAFAPELEPVDALPAGDTAARGAGISWTHDFGPGGVAVWRARMSGASPNVGVSYGGAGTDAVDRFLTTWSLGRGRDARTEVSGIVVAPSGRSLEGVAVTITVPDPDAALESLEFSAVR